MNPVVYRAASTGDSSFFESMTDPNSSTLLQVTIEKNTVLHLALQFKKKIEAVENTVNPSLVYETSFEGNTPLHQWWSHVMAQGGHGPPKFFFEF